MKTFNSDEINEARLEGYEQGKVSTSVLVKFEAYEAKIKYQARRISDLELALTAAKNCNND